MLYFTQANVLQRFTGSTWVQPGSASSNQTQQAMEEMFQLAHRHKISLIGDDDSANGRTDYPSSLWPDRLNGNLFTAAHGYAGPGTGVGNNIYSILSYGGFQQLWKTGNQGSVSEADVWLHANNWEQWFEDNAPTTDHFLYVCDECMGINKPGPSQVNTWASWLKANPGAGQNLRSMATVSFDTAQNQEPALDYVTDTDPGNSTVWANAVASIRSRPGGKVFMYNPRRPYAGSFTIEDDGVALRELSWAQYKMGVDRFFYWESTYYNDFQNAGQADTDVFEKAATFGGSNDTQDPVLGEWGYGHPTAKESCFIQART